MPTLEAGAIETARGFWLRKSQAHAEDPRQTARVAALLRSAVLPTDFYESALDLGCGRGRVIPSLSAFCGHVWAVDVVPELLCNIEFRAQSATAFCIEDEFKLPTGPHDLLWSAFFFQHVTKPEHMRAVCTEVRRVLRPGTRVFLLENGKDRAAHVHPWTPREYAVELGLGDYTAKLVSINNRPNDHWWIEGRMK